MDVQFPAMRYLIQNNNFSGAQPEATESPTYPTPTETSKYRNTFPLLESSSILHFPLLCYLLDIKT